VSHRQGVNSVPLFQSLFLFTPKKNKNKEVIMKDRFLMKKTNAQKEKRRKRKVRNELDKNIFLNSHSPDY